VGGYRAWSNTIICHAPKCEYSRTKLEQLVAGLAAAWNQYVRPRWIAQFRRKDEGGSVGVLGPLKDHRALHEVYVMDDMAAHVVPGGHWECGE